MNSTPVYSERMTFCFCLPSYSFPVWSNGLIGTNAFPHLFNKSKLHQPTHFHSNLDEFPSNRNNFYKSHSLAFASKRNYTKSVFCSYVFKSGIHFPYSMKFYATALNQFTEMQENLQKITATQQKSKKNTNETQINSEQMKSNWLDDRMGNAKMFLCVWDATNICSPRYARDLFALQFIFLRFFVFCVYMLDLTIAPLFFWTFRLLSFSSSLAVTAFLFVS